MLLYFLNVPFRRQSNKPEKQNTTSNMDGTSNVKTSTKILVDGRRVASVAEKVNTQTNSLISKAPALNPQTLGGKDFIPTI